MVVGAGAGIRGGMMDAIWDGVGIVIQTHDGRVHAHFSVNTFVIWYREEMKVWVC